MARPEDHRLPVGPRPNLLAYYITSPHPRTQRACRSNAEYRREPQLSRLLAQANQPLPPADFHARFVQKLNRSHSWLGAARSLTSIVRASLSGLALGITAPFAFRRGDLGLLAVSGAAIMIRMALQIP